MPPLTGAPISISFLPDLAARRGKLLSNASGRGTAVYAASFIRRRRIVFEASLLADLPQFRFFAVHEIFHFVWTRFGNSKRAAFAELLAVEIAHGARGELGESSGVKKAQLQPAECGQASRRWRDYVCESFCDTAAWLYAGTCARNLVLLANRWRVQRRDWFKTVFTVPRSC